MKRAVRTLIQIIAAGLMIFGVLEIILEIAHRLVQVRDHVDPIRTNMWSYVIGGALLLVGVILFVGSDSLAEQLTDDVEDDNEEPPTDEGNQ